MAKFTDPTGREWDLNLTAGDLKRIKRDAGVDLRDALKAGGESFSDKLDDPTAFLEFMWIIFGRQATIPREQFEALFDRATTVAAVAAVWEATWDFFRGQKAGTEARATLLAAVDEVEDATAAMLKQGPEWIRRRGRTSTDSVNDSPASSALTIDPSPCAN